MPVVYEVRVGELLMLRSCCSARNLLLIVLMLSLVGFDHHATGRPD